MAQGLSLFGGRRVHPGPGIKPVSAVLAGGFPTTEPPWKPLVSPAFPHLQCPIFLQNFCIDLFYISHAGISVNKVSCFYSVDNHGINDSEL